MSSSQKRLVIADLRGGRNGGEPPFVLGDNQCVDAVNIDYWGTTFGHKRLGASALGNTWAATYGPFTDTIQTILPVSTFADINDGSYEPYRYLVTNDADGVVGIVQATGSTPLTYGITGKAALITSGVEYKGALYFTGTATGATASRNYVIEWNGTLFSLRAMGLAAPAAAPTGANTGSGTYAATLRYYKVAYTVQRSGTTFLRSELSAALSFTPSGSGTGVIVTKPATISEGETHWELYGSADGTVYRKLATTAVATTTYVDSTAPSSYSGDAPPSVGENTVPGAWTYMIRHGNRLLGAGGNPYSRVWFTPVDGASDVGDAERVPIANYIDLDEQDGDRITGMAGNFNGSIWVFKYMQTWKLIPTGESDAPFQKVCLTKELGCVSHRSIVVGEDEYGNPALYFWSHRGPCRITTSNGIQYIGHDVEDYSSQRTGYTNVVGLYFNAKSQVWFWITLDDGTTHKLVFDVRLGRVTTGGVRGGWSRHTGASAAVTAAAEWNHVHISQLTEYARWPYVASTSATGLILWCDHGTQDYGTSYQAYVTTKPYMPGGLGVNCAIGQTHLLAEATAGTTIHQSIVRDYGQETRNSQVDLTPSASETRVLRQFEGSEMAGAGAIQFTVGDLAATTAQWSLDALVVPYIVAEDR